MHLYNKKILFYRYTYFVEPEDQPADNSDPYWKVRPLYNLINETAKDYVVQSEFVSIDETIVRYFGPNAMKQSIHGKPDR